MEFSSNCALPKSWNEIILGLKEESSVLFEEELEEDLNMFEVKSIHHQEEHLHDTIPHEDELNLFNKSERKIRRNLRAKKRKKSQREVALLEAYFEQDPEWSRKTVKELKPLLNLTVDQIYKWGYDRKHLIEKKVNNNFPKKRVRKAKTMGKYETKSKDIQSISQTENHNDHSFKSNGEFKIFLNWVENHQDQPNNIQNYLYLEKSCSEYKENKASEILSENQGDRNFFDRVSELFEIDYPSEDESAFLNHVSEFHLENLT